jgi:hypothetical protein
MKAFIIGSIALLILGSFGLINALHLPTVSNSPYSEVILPLYSNDSGAVIDAKLKRSAEHATIAPSVVLPVMQPTAIPDN